MNKKTLLYALPIYLFPLQGAQLPLSHELKDDASDQEEMKIYEPFAKNGAAPLNNQEDKPLVEPDHALRQKRTPAKESIDIAQLTNDTNRNFDIYLEVYKGSFFDCLRNAFHLLTRYSTEDLDTISDTVDRLTQCWRSLQKVEKQTPKLFDYLCTEANPIHLAEEKLQTLTTKVRQNIVEEMRKKSHALSHTLKVLALLTSLDDYRSNKGGTTFTSIYEANTDAFYAGVIGLGNIHKDMRRGSYEKVFHAIKNLQRAILQDTTDMVASNNLKGIQATVELELRNIMAAVRKEVMLSDGGRAKKNKAIEINDKLSDLEKAMRIFCSPDSQNPVLGKALQEDLRRKKEIVDQQLIEWITDFIRETENCIVSCNFLQAEEQLEQIRKIIAIFNENMVTLTQVKKTEKDAQPKASVTDGIKRLERAIEMELEKQRTYYKRIEPSADRFNPYFSNPPREICEKLEKVASKNARYQSAYSDIKKDIFQKLRKLMIRNLTDYEAAKKDFDLCRSILNSLPEKWALILEQELRQQEKRVDKEEKKDNDHFQKVIARGDIAEMATYLTELERKKDRTKASQVKATIMKGVDAQLKVFRENLCLPAQDAFLTACSTLQGLASLSDQYGEAVPQLAKTYASAVKELSSALNRRTAYINRTLKGGTKNPTLEDMKLVAAYVRQLHAYEMCQMDLNQ